MQVVPCGNHGLISNSGETYIVVCSAPNINTFLAPLRRSLEQGKDMRLSVDKRKVCHLSCRACAFAST